MAINSKYMPWGGINWYIQVVEPISFRTRWGFDLLIIGVICSFTNFNIMEQTRFQLLELIFDKNCYDEKQHILVKQAQA